MISGACCMYVFVLTALCAIYVGMGTWYRTVYGTGGIGWVVHAGKGGESTDTYFYNHPRRFRTVEELLYCTSSSF
jgi:hypothetical protein